MIDIFYIFLDTSKMSTQYCSTINTQKSNIMATLLFTPRTTIDANVFQNRLDNSPYHGEWNVRTGAYEFEIEEWEADELEENLSQELAYDINGRFEFQN